jgi:DNA-binding response OmpR family regulator
VRKRILIAEPDPDVRTLLELTVERLGHEVARRGDGGDVDAVVLEPACIVSRSMLRRFGRRIPPVVCLSIFPPHRTVQPKETVAYLQKPASSARLGAVLAGVLGP